jgi:heavy metal translocating P-type ATPase
LSENAASLKETSKRALHVAETAVCDLCGLPAGPALSTEAVGDREYNFCCPGCRQVFLMLSQATGELPHDFRESEVFRACMEAGIIPGNGRRPVSPSPPVPEINGEALELTFRADGMWCPACAWLIEEVLRRTPGVIDPRVSFFTDTVRLKYQPHVLTPAEIVSRVGRLGYTAFLPGATSEKNTAKHDLLVRLGVSAILSMNAMMFSSCLYFGFVRDLTQTVKAYFAFPLLLLSAPVVFYGGMPILRKAWTGIRFRALSMDTLVAVSTLSAFLYSLIQMARGSIHVYFDTAAMLVTIVLLGRYMEMRARGRVFEAVRAGLNEIGPGKVRIVENGLERWVSTRLVSPGDRFRTRPGERVALDGLIAAGLGLLDQSVVTGEPEPVAKGVGEHVIAGTLLTDGELEVSVTRSARDSSLKQMADLVTEALDKKNSGEQIADSLSRLFVPAVMAVAAVAGIIVWCSGAPADQILLRCLTVLLIACPCALGIAAPMVKIAVIGLGRKKGIFVRNPQALDLVPSLDTIVFDKTGTLTEGKFQLHEIVSDAADKESALSLIAAAEMGSSHFIAREIVRHARETGVHAIKPAGIEEFGGLGVTANVDGKKVFVGNRLLVERCGGEISSPLESQAGNREKSAMTVVFFGWDSLVRGFLVFGDSLRPGARELVEQLKAGNITVILLSGDGEITTRAVAGLLRIADFLGQKVPLEKADMIKRLQEEGHKVGMVGDGVNDAAALASADVAIALGAGNDIMKEASDLLISGGNLEKLMDVFDLSRVSIRTTRQNLCFAFLYNSIAIPVAAVGLLNPLIAVAAMLLSSLMVIGNALRISRGRRFG